MLERMFELGSPCMYASGGLDPFDLTTTVLAFSLDSPDFDIRKCVVEEFINGSGLDEGTNLVSLVDISPNSHRDPLSQELREILALFYRDEFELGQSFQDTVKDVKAICQTYGLGRDGQC